jgi:hypothetical protein
MKRATLLAAVVLTALASSTRAAAQGPAQPTTPGRPGVTRPAEPADQHQHGPQGVSPGGGRSAAPT